MHGSSACRRVIGLTVGRGTSAAVRPRESEFASRCPGTCSKSDSQPFAALSKSPGRRSVFKEVARWRRVQKGPSWNSWNLNLNGGGDSGKGNEQLEGGGRGCSGYNP